MDKTTSCVVYWLYNNRCICPWRHGYIGISRNWLKRLKRHRTNRGDFQWKHFFTGSVEDCMTIERQLRPRPGIGWNEAPGGEYGGGSAPKKEQTRELMRQAALHRYTDPAERERTSAVVKTALKNVDRSGTNNSNYGKQTSEAAKEKMRTKIIKRGGIAGSNNPMFGRKRTEAERRAISISTKLNTPRGDDHWIRKRKRTNTD